MYKARRSVSRPWPLCRHSGSVANMLRPVSQGGFNGFVRTPLQTSENCSHNFKLLMHVLRARGKYAQLRTRSILRRAYYLDPTENLTDGACIILTCKLSPKDKCNPPSENSGYGPDAIPCKAL